MRLQRPRRRSQTPQDFQRAALEDRLHVQLVLRRRPSTSRYFNSGANPVRAAGHRPRLPGRRRASSGRAGTRTPGQPTYTPVRAAPAGRSTRRTSTNWNNKQAQGLPRAPTTNCGYGSIYRSQLLDDRDRSRGITGKRKMTLPELIDAMEEAGTTDLRAHADLPLALQVVGSPRDPAAAPPRSRSCAPGRRRRAPASTATATASTSTPTRSGSWTPGGRCGCEAQFKPRARRQGSTTRCTARSTLDNAPNNHGEHLGSAYQDGWYGYVQQGPAHACSGSKVRGAVLARATAAAASSSALPRRRCEALADAPRSRRATTTLYAGRRGLRGREEGERPVVLRRGPPAPGRRRHPAADPLDQPPDLPAGDRGAGAVTSLTRGLGGLNLRVV